MASLRGNPQGLSRRMGGHDDRDLADRNPRDDPPSRQFDDRDIVARGVVHEGEASVRRYHDGKGRDADPLLEPVHHPVRGGVDEGDLVLAANRHRVLPIPRQDRSAARMRTDLHRFEYPLVPQIDNGDGAVVIVRNEGQPSVRCGRRRERTAAGRVFLFQAESAAVEQYQPVGLLGRDQVFFSRQGPDQEGRGLPGGELPNRPIGTDVEERQEIEAEPADGECMAPRQDGDSQGSSPGLDRSGDAGRIHRHAGHPTGSPRGDKGGGTVRREGDLVGVLAGIEDRQGADARPLPAPRRSLHKFAGHGGGVVAERCAVPGVLEEGGELRKYDPRTDIRWSNPCGHQSFHLIDLGRQVVPEPGKILDRGRGKVARHHMQGPELDQIVEAFNPVDGAALPHGGAGIIQEQVARCQDPLGGRPDHQVAPGMGRTGMEHHHSVGTEFDLLPSGDRFFRQGEPAGLQRLLLLPAGRAFLKSSQGTGPALRQSSPGPGMGEDPEVPIAETGHALGVIGVPVGQDDAANRTIGGGPGSGQELPGDPRREAGIDQ